MREVVLALLVTTTLTATYYCAATAVSRLRGSTVTLKGKNIPFTTALEEVKKQTGNRVEDLRSRYGQPTPELQLNLDWQKTPFWEAVDGIARQAKMEVQPIARDNAVGLLNRRSTSEVPIRHVGPFRLAITRMESSLDFLRGNRSAIATIQLMWEPKIIPWFLKVQADSYQVIVADGQTRTIQPTSLGTVPLLGQQGKELPIHFSTPMRDVRAITALKGKWVVLVSAGMAEFEFKDWIKGARQERQGLAVGVGDFKAEGNVWRVNVQLDYPRDRLELESHQGFVTDANEIRLVRNGTQYKSRNHLISVTEGGPIRVTYEFVNLPGKGEDYELHYRAPSAPEPFVLEFGFNDVPLP